ncbi:unnamed protein product [Owenia fusiformis]|uniref:Uncharacterized protein n=1 Tax=Owenia fusiformis TaxID=6347 RepID=A0A8S4NSE3_OWEFU|nr:unnamed protein product [Owenia fusiformis]
MFKLLLLAVLVCLNRADEMFGQRCAKRVFNIKTEGQILDFSVSNSHMAVVVQTENRWTGVGRIFNSHIGIYKMEADRITAIKTISNITSALRAKFAPSGDLIVLCGPNDFYQQNHMTKILDPLSERPKFTVLYASSSIRCDRPYFESKGPFFKPTSLGINRFNYSFFLSNQDSIQYVKSYDLTGNSYPFLKGNEHISMRYHPSSFAIHPVDNEIYVLDLGYVLVFSFSDGWSHTTATWEHGLYQCSNIQVDKHGNVLIVAHGPDRIFMYPPSKRSDNLYMSPDIQSDQHTGSFEHSAVGPVVLPNKPDCHVSHMNNGLQMQRGEFMGIGHGYIDTSLTIVNIEIDHKTDKLYVLKWSKDFGSMFVEEWRYTESKTYEKS